MNTWTVHAPVRADLAGGTLDIWPLSVIVPGAATLNCTLSTGVEIHLEPRSGPTRLVHADTGVEGPVPSDHPDLALLSAAVMDSATLQEGWTLSLHTDIPRGSGLGTSSAVLTAILALDAVLCEEDPDIHQLVRRAADIEARLIQCPTGIQDAIAPLSGGISHIRFRIGGWDVERLPIPRELAERSLLVFTGIHHFSGAPNWELLKAWFDDPVWRPRFRELAETTAEAVTAVRNGDISTLARAMTRDFRIRTSLPAHLVPEAIAPYLDHLLDDPNVTGFRLCGAAGGGSIFIICEPGQRASVRTTAAEFGCRPLDLIPDDRSLTIAAD